MPRSTRFRAVMSLSKSSTRAPPERGRARLDGQGLFFVDEIVVRDGRIRAGLCGGEHAANQIEHARIATDPFGAVKAARERGGTMSYLGQTAKDDAAGFVAQENRVGNGIEQPLNLGRALFYALLEFGVEFLEGLPGAIALRDIARDAEHMPRLAVGIGQQRRGDFRRDDAPVLAALVHFQDRMPHATVGPQRDLHLGGQPSRAGGGLGRQREREIGADHFLRPIAQNRQRCCTHVAEGARAQIEEPDDVGCIFGDQPVAFLAGAQRLGGAHAFGDVATHAQ